MLTYTLSAFADEVSPDLSEQLGALERNGIHHVEFRGVWGKNVLDLNDAEVQDVAETLRKRGVRVSAIGSPIGKIAITDDFAPHFARFERALELTHRFGTQYVRVFSFFMPARSDPARFRDEVLRRMSALCDAAERFDASIVLLHENEKEIYGDTGDRCADLARTLNRRNFWLTFDPANFVQVGQRPFTEAYPLLYNRIRYIHIKDAMLGDGRVVPAGEGDGELRRLLADLASRDFSGFLSLEPHLAHAGRNDGFSGAELFGRAADALKGLLAELETTV